MHSYTDTSIPCHSALQRLSPSFLMSVKGGDCPPPLTVLPSLTVTSPLWLSSLHRLSPPLSYCSLHRLSPPPSYCSLHRLSPPPSNCPPFTDCHLHFMTVLPSQSVTSTHDSPSLPSVNPSQTFSD